MSLIITLYADVLVPIFKTTLATKSDMIFMIHLSFWFSWNKFTKQQKFSILEIYRHLYIIGLVRDCINNALDILHSCTEPSLYCTIWHSGNRFDVSYSVWVTVYLKKYAHGFVVLCFVVVMQSFIMNSLEVFIHIHQGCFAGTGAIVRLPQCQWSKPDGYGKISHCITTAKHSKAKTVCIFLGIYCIS